MKHFPGDGIDERDQHVVTSYNTARSRSGTGPTARSDCGSTTACSPSWSATSAARELPQLRPGMDDADILPATLAPELLPTCCAGSSASTG